MPRPRKDRLEHHVRSRKVVRGPRAGETAYDVRVPTNRNGHGTSGTSARTFYDLDDACAWRDEQLTAYRRGEAVHQTAATVGELLTRWLDDEASSRVRSSTLSDYRDTVRVHLIPRVSTKRADKLTPSDVHKLIADMERDGVGCRTRQLSLLRLKQALAWSTDMELLRRNVAAGITAPRCTPGEKRALTPSEKRDFLSAARHDPLWPLWRVYLMTGLRRGEGLGLRWQDVDFAGGTLSVRQQAILVQHDDGKTRVRLDQLKTPSSLRTIETDGDTLVHLRTHLDALKVRRGDGANGIAGNGHLVFCTRHGTPLNPNNVLRNFARIKADCGLASDITIHSLRHTHATDCIEAGMDWLALAARLGHASPSISHDLYGHHRPGRERAIIDRLAAELGGVPELTG